METHFTDTDLTAYHRDGYVIVPASSTPNAPTCCGGLRMKKGTVAEQDRQPDPLPPGGLLGRIRVERPGSSGASP